MRNLVWPFLILQMVVLSSKSFALQDVAGMKIAYEAKFQSKPDTAKAWLSKASPIVRKNILAVEIYEAPPPPGLLEIRLMKVQYVASLQGNIDSSAASSMDGIARLEGITNAKHSVVKKRVSGHDVRQASFEASRYGGRLGAEFLVVYDKRRNVLYQLQLIFGRKKALNLFDDLKLETERKAAKDLLATVSFLE